MTADKNYHQLKKPTPDVYVKHKIVDLAKSKWKNSMMPRT